MSDHTDDRETQIDSLEMAINSRYGTDVVHRLMAALVVDSDWLKARDERMRAEGRREVAASVEATFPKWDVYSEDAGHHIEIRAQLQAAISDVGVDAHNRAVAATAWDEGFAFAAPILTSGEKFSGSPRNPYRADATERGNL